MGVGTDHRLLVATAPILKGARIASWRGAEVPQVTRVRATVEALASLAAVTH